MRPSGPEPRTLSSRKPRSRATLRAAGVARGRSPSSGANSPSGRTGVLPDALSRHLLPVGEGAAGGDPAPPLPRGEGRGEGAGGVAAAAGGTKVSPSATIQPMQAPTGSTSPSDAATNFKTPEAGASTSIAALSVSISNSVAPLTTWAPSAACHRPIRPELMSMSTRGMTISTAMSDLGQRQTPRRRDNVVDLRNGGLLQDRAIGNRRLRRRRAA